MCKHRETGAEEMIRLSICSAGARIVQSTLRIRSRARFIIEPAMDAGLTKRNARLPYPPCDAPQRFIAENHLQLPQKRSLVLRTRRVYRPETRVRARCRRLFLRQSVRQSVLIEHLQQ